ncbi:MAG: hypothetical protein F7B60_01470 [Desulfurococcales archaeon]|nr:hypothetical protein [Desulfurococcales archaeon]
MAANPRPTDYMIKCMASLIEDGESVYHGLTSQLPVLAMVYAARVLKRDFVWISVIESNMPVVERVRITPSTGDPYSQPYSVSDLTTIDVFDLAARGRVDVMFFGAAQVDERGNTNLTVIGDYKKPRVKLPGGAATAFLFPLIKKLIIWSRHDKRNLVKKVDFITGHGGGRVERSMPLYLCTSKALIEYVKEGPVLKAIFEGVTVGDVLENSSMNIIIRGEPEIIKAPDKEAMTIINEHDPRGLRYLQGYG